MYWNRRHTICYITDKTFTSTTTSNFLVCSASFCTYIHTHTHIIHIYIIHTHTRTRTHYIYIYIYIPLKPKPKPKLSTGVVPRTFAGAIINALFAAPMAGIFEAMFAPRVVGQVEG